MVRSKRRVTRLSKRLLSSSVRDGGRVSIEVIVVISPIVPAIVVVGIGVVQFWGAALLVVILVFAVAGAGVFLSSASSGGSVLFRGFERSLLL